jgi:hypothetical protein
MSSDTKNIYEQYVKPLSREEQRALLDLLQTDINNGDDGDQRRSILELHGLGQEIWQGVDPRQYVSDLRKEWDERVG